jgi:spermidine synthase
VAQRDSWYGEIAVFDDDEARFLLIDGMLHTAMPHAPAEITGRCHLFTERYYLELLPYYRPTAKRGLLIGLGGGLLPQVLQGYGLEMDAVEIDPVVVGFARTHFHYTGPVVVADGRQYVQQTEGAGTGARTYDWAGAEARPYDFVVLDAYCSDVAPFHLGTREMFASVRRVLTPGGVLAINHVGRPRGFATACLVRTLRAVFAHVEVFATEPGDDVQFLAVFASNASLRLPETPEPV